jgi:hypothetical protein
VSKKDYVRLAGIIRAAMIDSVENEPMADAIVTQIQRDIGDWLHDDNPNFDPDSWTEACKP